MYRGGIFITGIFGNFDTKRGGEENDFLNGNSRWPWRKACPQTQILDPPQPVLPIFDAISASKVLFMSLFRYSFNEGS